MSKPSSNCAHDNTVKQVLTKCVPRVGFATIFHRADGAREPKQGSRGEWRTPCRRANAAASGPVSSHLSLTAPESYVTTTKVRFRT